MMMMMEMEMEMVMYGCRVPPPTHHRPQYHPLIFLRRYPGPPRSVPRLTSAEHGAHSDYVCPSEMTGHHQLALRVLMRQHRCQPMSLLYLPAPASEARRPGWSALGALFESRASSPETSSLQGPSGSWNTVMAKLKCKSSATTEHF